MSCPLLVCISVFVIPIVTYWLLSVLMTRTTDMAPNTLPIEEYIIIGLPTTVLPSLCDGSRAAANQLVCNPGFFFISFLHYSVTRGLKRGCAAGWIRGSPLIPSIVCIT
jgi:hypothetical protein